jgi:excisionase family DNA binding protein
MGNKKALTTGEVARICSVSGRTVAGWIDAGRLDGYRIPGSRDRRVTHESLRRFIKDSGMPISYIEKTNADILITFVGADDLASERVAGGILNRWSGGGKISTRSFAVGFEFAVAESVAISDVVLIDLSIGRYESLLIARTLSRDYRYEKTSLIAVVNEDEVRQGEMSDNGFDEVFRKPIDVKKLAATIIAAMKLAEG